MKHELCKLKINQQLIPQSVLRLYLHLPVDSHQSSFFDLELALDRIDEEGQLTLPGGVFVGGALHLPLVQFDPHFGQHLARLIKADIARRFQVPFTPFRVSYSL